MVSEPFAGQNVGLKQLATPTLSVPALADGDIAVLAGRDVKVLAAQNTYSEEHTAESKSSSLMLAAGFAPRQTIYGTTRTSSQSQGKGNTATAALLSANTGNLAVTAGTDAAQHANTGAGNVTSQGADLIAGKKSASRATLSTCSPPRPTASSTARPRDQERHRWCALAGTVGGVITQAYDMAGGRARRHRQQPTRWCNGTESRLRRLQGHRRRRQGPGRRSRRRGCSQWRKRQWFRFRRFVQRGHQQQPERIPRPIAQRTRHQRSGREHRRQGV